MSSMRNAVSFIMIDYDVYSQSPSLSRGHEGDSNDCMRPEIVGWYTGALLAPSCLRKGIALSSTAKIWIPTWPKYSSFSRKVTYPDLLK